MHEGFIKKRRKLFKQFFKHGKINGRGEKYLILITF